MTVFADSSALVKLYADEPGADLVRAQVTFAVSVLARVELPSAFWRKQRSGQLSEQDARVLTAAFEADWHDDDSLFLPLVVNELVLEEAAALTARHGLRAYDAVQLATAGAARAAGAELDAFLCFDVDLAAAAAREGWAPPS